MKTTATSSVSKLRCSERSKQFAAVKSKARLDPKKNYIYIKKSGPRSSLLSVRRVLSNVTPALARSVQRFITNIGDFINYSGL